MLIFVVGAADAQTPAAPDHILFAEAALESDHRFEGLSNSDRHATVEASLYLWRPDKWFAGTTLNGVDNGASYEIDLYGGRSFDVHGTQLPVQALTSLFPDKKDNGAPTYDFVQASLALSRRFGPLTFGAKAAWTPAASAGAGEAWSTSVRAEAPVARWLTFSGQLGRRDAELGQDRTWWDLGGTLFWRDFALDVRYVATDLSRAQCFGTDWCVNAFTAKLTWHIPNGYPWR